ncbi:MAG: DUF3347 domain-containing protein [Bacteroidota bacterium]|nr:DUF3347 domain-containing protein [Bacteroidota bacterium]MDX5431042.1 DUF3347 domain-containing protein [Bacteroidota bacterium]MDX5469796.1 DUF3347 domain-containing protein [Bacteroidota bacterium]
MKRFLFQKLFVLFAISSQATPIEQLINPYVELKNALVTGQFEAGQTAAEKLHKASQNKDLFKGTVQAATYAKYQSTLVKLAKTVSTSTTLEAQRKAFAALSLELISMLDEQKNWGITLYQFCCPMKKAYWISLENEVRNPYYGTKMLDCGKMEKVVK